MEKVTINKLLSLMKIIRERLTELRSLRGSLATKEKYSYFRPEDQNMNKTIEPQYDIKIVDQKVVQLENFLYQADAEIKASNARTNVNLEIPIDLLESLK